MLSPPIPAHSWDEKGVDRCCVSVSHLTVLTSSMLAPVEFDHGQLQLAFVCTNIREETLQIANSCDCDTILRLVSALTDTEAWLDMDCIGL